MPLAHIFEFRTELELTKVPVLLNNPFASSVPEIAQVAAKEFQTQLGEISAAWSHDFIADKGKMFGVLVVQRLDLSYGYLAAVSGKLPGEAFWPKLVPSVFDDSADDYFLNRGMRELSQISQRVKASDDAEEINALKESSRHKSVGLQQRLFENYRFMNVSGEQQNLIEIFEGSGHGKPPTAAGECAAPKLLHYALTGGLKPIALAEFWWGKTMKSETREHRQLYPACKNRCQPILEYMLQDFELYARAQE